MRGSLHSSVAPWVTMQTGINHDPPEQPVLLSVPGQPGEPNKRSEGDREAREYRIRTASGEVAIISDQTEIHVDDCVVVENPGGNSANIRRVANTFCDPESSEVVSEIQDELQEEAQECVSAKNELVNAQDDAAVDRALRKVSILCDT